jgi:hypothetical protein
VKHLFVCVLLAGAALHPCAAAAVPIEIRASPDDAAVAQLANDTKREFKHSSMFTVVEHSPPAGVTLFLMSIARTSDHGRSEVTAFIEARQAGRSLPVETVSCSPRLLENCAEGIVRTAVNAVSGRPDLRNFPTFMTLEVRPSFEPEFTTLYIGRFETDPTGVFWFKRERVNQWKRSIKHEDYTTTDLCPDALVQVQALQHLQMPEPDVPGVEPDYTKLILDGVGYALSGHSVHPDGQPGEFRIESNVGSPLAKWADSMLKSLAGCWRPLD